MNIYKWDTEKVIFYSVLVLNLLLLSLIKFYPSMDGPCHLYNSNVIWHLIKGDSSVISQFYTINQFVIPNWTSHIILSIFNSFLPAWVAEKILMILYFTGFVISFRLLIKQLNPQNISLSILGMPFAYSFLFHLGFYNYSLSFIFLFLTLYYWLRHYETLNWYRYGVLSILLISTYLSAILTFFFLGFCMGLFIVAFGIRDYYKERDKQLIFKDIGFRLLFLLVASLPSLFFSAIFFNATNFFPSTEHYSTSELTKWLNDIRCLIVYAYDSDRNLTGQFLHIAIAILSISFFIRFYNKERLFTVKAFRKGDVLIIPLLFSLLLFFLVPDGSNAGMMSDRFCLLSYMFFIIWVSSQFLPYKVSRVFVWLIIVFHVGLLFKHHNGTLKGLNKDALAIYHAADHIESNSIVLPVNMSDHWLELHFSNYLGGDKPLVILENYEASVGWFPVNWNTPKLPRLKLGDLDTVSGIQWMSNTQSAEIKQIDYVFLFGNTTKINDLKWAELKAELAKNFKLVYRSEKDYTLVYKRI